MSKYTLSVVPHFERRDKTPSKEELTTAYNRINNFMNDYSNCFASGIKVISLGRGRGLMDMLSGGGDSVIAVRFERDWELDCARAMINATVESVSDEENDLTMERYRNEMKGLLAGDLLAARDALIEARGNALATSKIEQAQVLNSDIDLLEFTLTAMSPDHSKKCDNCVAVLFPHGALPKSIDMVDEFEYLIGKQVRFALLGMDSTVAVLHTASRADDAVVFMVGGRRRAVSRNAIAWIEVV